MTIPALASATIALTASRAGPNRRSLAMTPHSYSSQLLTIVTQYPEILWCASIDARGTLLDSRGTPDSIPDDVKRKFIGSQEEVRRLFQYTELKAVPQFWGEGDSFAAFFKPEDDVLVAMFGSKSVPPARLYQIGIMLKAKVF
jgi:hypothetical protein